MASGNPEELEPLADRVPALLFATGGLYALAALYTAQVGASGGTGYQAVNGPLLSLALVTSLLALIGVYSTLDDGTSGLVQAAGAVASFALLAAIPAFLWSVASSVGPVPPVPDLVAILALAMVALSFGLGGAAVLRTPVYPPLAGTLFGVEAFVLAFVIAGPGLAVQGTAPVRFTVGVALTQALVLLWAGSLTWGGSG